MFDNLDSGMVANLKQSAELAAGRNDATSVEDKRAAYVALSVRRLETRNLCSNGNDEDTCRVTVSDRDFGVVHALVVLRPEDDVGEHSASVGSLLRVAGKFGEDLDPNDGSPVLRGEFYRHWPRNFYVTKSKADLMRQ